MTEELPCGKKGVLALTMIDEWLAWAARCRIPAFVEFGRKIKKNQLGIEAAMLNNLTNAFGVRTAGRPETGPPSPVRGR